MRVVKEAAERRNEILDVAERLFCTKGYDNTSTNELHMDAVEYWQIGQQRIKESV